MKRNSKNNSSRIVNIGLTQMACSADAHANLAKQIGLVERAAKGGAQIICMQELFRSQYFCQVEDHRFFKLAETIPGPSTDAFCKLAKKHKAVVIASLFEKRTQGLYHNTAVVIDADGSILGVYRKMHIPDDPLYYEKFYFTPGDTGFRTWNTKYAKIGVLICWDPREKKLYGTAQHESWELIQRSHAVANGCYVCAPNRIGLEKIRNEEG